MYKVHVVVSRTERKDWDVASHLYSLLIMLDYLPLCSLYISLFILDYLFSLELIICPHA